MQATSPTIEPPPTKNTTMNATMHATQATKAEARVTREISVVDVIERSRWIFECNRL